MEDPTKCIYHLGLEERLSSVCQKMNEKEKLFNALLSAQKDALAVASKELDRRLEDMNQFRAQLSGQASTFVTVKELDIRLDKLEEKFLLTIKPVSDKLRGFENLQLREEGSLTWKNGIITALISMAIFLLAHWIIKF